MLNCPSLVFAQSELIFALLGWEVLTAKLYLANRFRHYEQRGLLVLEQVLNLLTDGGSVG
jgi:hypothetical protein